MLEIAIGTLSATLCILILARFEKIPQQRFCGMALVIAALIYLGFGIFASNMNWLLIEFGGLVIFLTLAILGIRKSVWFLALGWLTHIIWDVALHSEAPFVPEWYPLACVSFDLIIGFYIAFRLTSKQSLSNPWLWKMAWRDSRTHRKRLFLFMTSIVMGIAALVSIGSFGQTLEKAMDDQAKTLLGADLMFSSLQPFTPEIEAFIDSIGGEQAREWLFISMAYFPKTQESRLVQVRSLKGDFPFYGEIATDPKAAVNNYKAGPNALVDNVLMLQYHATPGDSIKIGATTFNIAARITKTPNNPAIASTFNPRVFIPPDYLEETNLIQRGSLVRYRVYFKFDDDPVNELPTDYTRLKSIGKRGILLLLSDSTNAESPDHSLSEKEIMKNLDIIFKQAKGRIITATFASLINRIQQIITLSEKYGRRVALEGYSLRTNVEIAKQLGYIKAKKGTFI
ncbi:ABC transporter permease, partial [candidate division KSB1 bacterium]|nr:ABC transporter permease [candidate division KSB1 bacterium]